MACSSWATVSNCDAMSTKKILVLTLASQVQQGECVKRVVGGQTKVLPSRVPLVYLLSESSSKAGGVSLLNKRMWLVVVLWLGMRLISPHDKACLSLTLSQILLLLLASFLLHSSCSGVGRIFSSLVEHTGSLLASWNFETTSFPSPARSYHHRISPRQSFLRISSAMRTEHPPLLYTPLYVPMYSFMRLSPDLPATCSSNFLLSR